MNHFRTKKTLPADTVIFPADRRYENRHPKPDADPVGTYGINKRLVYRVDDTEFGQTEKCWRDRNLYPSPFERPIDMGGDCFATHPLYCSWQVVPEDKYLVLLQQKYQQVAAERERDRERMRERERARQAFWASEAFRNYREQYPTLSIPGESHSSVDQNGLTVLGNIFGQLATVTPDGTVRLTPSTHNRQEFVGYWRKQLASTPRNRLLTRCKLRHELAELWDCE